MLQTFHGSPITGALIVTSGALTLVTGGSGTGTALAALPIAGMPPVAWFPSASTALCVGTVLFQCRHWERRKGSGRFLMLAVLPILILVVAAVLAPTTFANVATITRRRAAPIAAWRLICDPAWAAISACLAVRFVQDVPACNPRTHRLTDKWPALAALVKLVVIDTVFGLSQSKPGAVVASAAIGAVVGLVAGLPAVRGSKLMTWLDGCRPFEGFVRALSAVVAGGDVIRRVARPTPPQQQQQAVGGFPGGAMPPGMNQHPDLAPGDGMGRMAPRAAAAAAAAPQQQQAQAAQIPQQDPASVQLLMGLGLGCTTTEAEQALHLANGNVDAAAALLMDRH